jgi:hypothetical protein
MFAIDVLKLPLRLSDDRPQACVLPITAVIMWIVICSRCLVRIYLDLLDLLAMMLSFILFNN